MTSTAPERQSPFHEGELAIQTRVGVKDKVARFGERAVLPFMPGEHRELVEQLPFVFVGSLDATGHPRASMVWGLPGFVDTPDDRTLRVEGTLASGDPLHENLVVGAPLGLLGLELETRSRIRANGTVLARDGDSFTLGVKQSFGNCQKYIQIREAALRRDPSIRASVEPSVESATLSETARAMVSASDTFFIASSSSHPSDATRAEGVDVSHRGGLPGFVRVEHDDAREQTTLMFPDYIGNFLFNTLGNILVNPKVGLLFVDFDRGGLLSLRGTASVVWEGEEVRAVEGAQRLVRVFIDGGVYMPDALPFRWSAPGFAPQFRKRGEAPSDVARRLQ